jgi:hypothetical protein
VYDALTNLKIEFETIERPMLRTMAEATETKVVYTQQVKSMRKHAIACLLTVFALGCLYVAWDGWRHRKLMENIHNVVEVQKGFGRPSNFDRFYADFVRAGGSEKLTGAK